MNRFTDPEIIASFHRRGADFVSRSAGGVISCPPYVIASVAQDRVVEGAELSLPNGHNEVTLSQIRDITGRVDQDVQISASQAEGLAQIGRQIISLNETGQIQPPLNHYQEQSIGHLVAQVDIMLANH